MMLTVAFHQLRLANADEKIPMLWGRPRQHPGTIYLLRALGLVPLLLSAASWGQSIGYWSVGLVAAAFLPTVVLNVWHNRQIETAQPIA
ncbi:hypothetical protein [Citricoccus sp. GCM10030269]|uniref:hypothetical protein n=1 Tax=Citricoccus sp. GCM10030269 TaxID=3273388 RepID=UPI003623CA89